METFKVRLEHCPKCHSVNTENLVRVQMCEPIRVYVRCRECGTFVARYTLERYTSDKTYESLLRYLRNHGHSISSRDHAREVEGFSAEVKREFAETAEAPRSKERLDELIWDHKR
jgi:phage FluMu protein Com